MTRGRFLVLAAVVLGAAASAIGAGKSADAIFQEIGTTSPHFRSATDRHRAHARRAALITINHANDEAREVATLVNSTRDQTLRVEAALSPAGREWQAIIWMIWKI